MICATMNRYNYKCKKVKKVKKIDNNGFSELFWTIFGFFKFSRTILFFISIKKELSELYISLCLVTSKMKNATELFF